MKNFARGAFALIGCLLMLVAATQADAGDCIKNQDGNVVCGEGQCAMDQYGKVFCAKAGGGAVRDRNGDVKCGVGFCAPDDLGQIKCSTKPGGSAATDSNGKVKCLGGCQNARPQLCGVAR
jgi:hypothetical protein